MSHAVFWVIPRRLNFIFRRFGTLCLFHLHRQVVYVESHTCLWRWKRQGVPKRRHINFRRRGITQKKAYKYILHANWLYSYCYVCSVLGILFHCLYVNVYCTTATGCQPNCSYQIYHITWIPEVVHKSFVREPSICNCQWPVRRNWDIR